MGKTAFGSLFFLTHQRKLLWLLNTPVVRIWFRYVLRIHGESSSVGRRRIFRILPHAIFWWDGPYQKAEFRTHAKFSKRLYYAFRPLWWAMHAWDWCVADRWVPELSFGFSILTAYPDADPESTSVDGRVQRTGVDEAWATIIAGAGNAADDTSASTNIMRIQASATTDQWAILARYICLFDTSALGAYVNITEAVLSLFGAGTKVDDLSSAPTANIYTSNPASNTSLAASDFSNCGSVAQCDTAITYAGWSSSAYNDFTFNATGRGNISKISISKFSFRNANYDVAASPPAWVSGAASYYSIYMAEQTGTTNDPKLVVTYNIDFTHTGTIYNTQSYISQRFIEIVRVTTQVAQQYVASGRIIDIVRTAQLVEEMYLNSVVMSEHVEQGTLYSSQTWNSYVEFLAGLVLQQEGFRFRNDDGTEATASWKYNQDANMMGAAGTPFRVRFVINATGDPGARNWQLEYRRSATDNWRKVN